MGSTKLDFGGPFTTKKESIFLLRVSLFFNECIQNTLHFPRASENFPLEKSQKIRGKTTSKKLMEGPSLFASLPSPFPRPFQFLRDFSHFQTLPPPLIFPRSAAFLQHSICEREGKDPSDITRGHNADFPQDQDIEGWA